MAEVTVKPGLGKLDDLPRVTLAHLPTPIEPMENLAAELGRGGGLYVKRDDCTGLAFGGNKVRQLEFYLGEARAEGADTVLITGAVQSNFVRSAAAAAAKLGMECHAQLEERVPGKDGAYRMSGNVLLDRMLGATIYSYAQGEDEEGADRRLHEIADALKERGRRPYIVPLAPGHKPLGALGYVDAAREILGQLAAQPLRMDEIVVASGSGARISWSEDPTEAVRGANFVYTDTWTSMGQEDEREQRKKVFEGYQLNAELLANADDAYVLHCLPAHRGQEVSSGVADGAQSRIWPQAQNRMHTARGVFSWLATQ